MPENEIPTSDSNSLFYLFIVLVALFILFSLIVGFVQLFGDFSRELRFLNNEISRSKGVERRNWKRRRCRLWLSLLPFVKY